MACSEYSSSDQLLSPITWITTTTRTGDTSARIGIAEHIGGAYFSLQTPTEFCSLEDTKNRLVNANLIDSSSPRWPDVLIGPCFHIPYMQMVKTLSGGNSLVVALRPPVRGLDIRAASQDINNTDIIVSYPYHDNRNLPNVLLCDTIANRVTDALLQKGKSRWEADFAPFVGQGEVIGLLVGGDVGDKRRVFTPAIAKKLGVKVNEIATASNCTLLVSASARTTPECINEVCAQLTVPYYLYDPTDPITDNPYFGILGTVDYVIVTADSISMCCEAASSGKPVYIFFDDEIVESAHAMIAHHLVKRGYARFLDDKLHLHKFVYAPENSAKKIAEKVCRILHRRKPCRA